VLRRIAALGVAFAAAVVVPTATGVTQAAGSTTVAMSTTEATAYQQDAAHDGYQPGDSFTFPLAQSWQSADLGGTLTYPVVTGGRVFVISNDPTTGSGYLWAFDVVSGAKLWGPLDVVDRGHATLAADAGRLFVENSLGFVRALDPATGAELWGEQVRASDLSTIDPANNITAANGAVYVNTWNGVVALDETNGAERWRGFAGYFPYGPSSPAVTADGVYVNGVTKRNPASGTAIWSTSVAGTGTVAVAGGRVFTHSPFDTAAQLDATTGSVLTPFNSAAGPAIDLTKVYWLDDAVVSAADPQQLVATSLASNAKAWTFAGDSQLLTAPIATPSAVFVASATGNVYAVDPATGAQLWTAQVPALDNRPSGYSTPFDQQNTVSMAVAESHVFVPSAHVLTVFADANVTGTPQSSPAPDPVTAPATGLGASATSIQENAGHDGVAAGDDTSLPLHHQWSIDLGAPVSYPLIARGRVYAVAEQLDRGDVYAFDQQTGARIWGPIAMYGAAFGPGTAQITLDGATLYVTDNRLSVYAFDADSGVHLWSHLGTDVLANPIPTAADGKVFTGPGATAYDGVTGTALWRTLNDASFDSRSGAVAVAGGRVIGAASNAVTSAFDETTGVDLWHTTGLAGGNVPFVTTANAQRVIAIDEYDPLTARVLDAITGKPTGDLETSRPAALAGDAVWAVQARGLAAYDLAGRRQSWFYSDSTLASPPVVSGGEVFVSTDDGRLLAIDATAGTPTWTGTLSAPAQRWAYNMETQPALAVAHGIVAVPAGNFLDVFADLRFTAPDAAPTLPTRPDPTANVTVTNLDNGSVRVSWSAASPPNGLAGYLVSIGPGSDYYNPGARDERWVPANATQVTLDDMQPGKSYYVYVVTIDGMHAFSLRSPGVADVPPTVPTTPDPVTVDVGDGYLRLSWPPSTTDPASPVRGYNVYRSTDPSSGGTWTLVSSMQTATVFKDTAVSNDTYYYYRVTAVNGVGESAWDGILPRGVPHVPPTVTLTSHPPAATTSTSATFYVEYTLAAPAQQAGSYQELCSLDGGFQRGCGYIVQFDSLVEGHHTFVVTIRDGLGESATASYSWWIDKSAPTAHLTGPVAAFQLSPTINVAWAGADAASGVASYDVRWRYATWNGSAFSSYRYPSGWQHTSSVHATLSGSPGDEYCFSVRARDRAGNLSGWSAERCTSLPLDDRSLAVTAGKWTRAAASSDYRGTDTRVSATGATLTLTGAFAGSLALVATVCPTCGSIDVIVNGRLLHSVSLRSSALRHHVLIALPSFSQGRVTVTLRTTSRALALIDGLAVRRT